MFAAEGEGMVSIGTAVLEKRVCWVVMRVANVFQTFSTCYLLCAGTGVQRHMLSSEPPLVLFKGSAEWHCVPSPVACLPANLLSISSLPKNSLNSNPDC